MASTRRRRGIAARLVFWAALTLAGAGAGAAAALATSGSGLIRAAGGAIGGIAGLCSAAWADTAQQRREATAAAIGERDQVLDPVINDPANDLSVLGLLLPTRQAAAPFRGRTADLAWLQAWQDNPDSHPTALVTGPGGTGKTRLVTQFAATLPPPWAAGWLHPGRGATALPALHACDAPAVILIDDADTSPDVAALLADLAGQPQAAQVRVLLTARTTDALAQVAGQLPESARWIIAPDNLPVRTIGPFGSTDDQARWFGEAARAYAAARRTPPPNLPASTATGNTRAADEPFLTIQAQALLAVLETERRRPPHPDVQALPFDQVAEALFAHEERRWQQAAQHPGWGPTDLDAPTQQRAIAALMLSGAVGEPDAVTALRAVPDLADAAAERLARIARWAFHLYPPGPVRIQPDMLAEWFLITQLTSAPGLATHLNDLTGQRIPAVLTLLAHASDHMAAALPLYARLIQADPPARAAAAADAALTASTAQPLLDATLASLVTSTHWPPDTLVDLDRHLPEGTLPRTRAAVSAATVNYAQKTGIREGLAYALVDHGVRLGDLGRHREALAAEEEALALYRDLAAANPAHQPLLARALNSRSVSLQHLGRHWEALAAEEEALALYRPIAANPAHQPSLARVLINYGNSLMDLGRHPEALAAREEALALYRDLAATNPAHQPNLALTLNNYGLSLRGLGRHREALAAEEEAVALYRELAATNPAQQPGLAMALNNSAGSLRDLGRHLEALAAEEEAVALYRDLAAANPAHQVRLSLMMSNHGISLADLGRHQEALANFEEAVALYRDLAAANPAHQPSLARTLNNYSVCLRELGRHSEALTCDREALEMHAMLARNDPDLYQETYQHYLAVLRRTYDLRGDQSTSVSLHLRRDN